MAITGTARGTGNTTTGTTSATFAPTSDFAANSFGVLVIAMDNAGSAGGTTIGPASGSGGDGSVWTRRLNVLYDNTAASAGAELAIYTADSTSLTSAQSVSMTLGGAAVARAHAFWQFVPDAGFQMSFGTGAGGTGVTSGTPTVTTGSITSGDVVIGGGAVESANTWVADADTLNGSWSAMQAAAGGTGTTGQSVTSQYKVVTATGAQTYNPTLTSADCIVGWISATQTLIPVIPDVNFAITRT